MLLRRAVNLGILVALLSLPWLGGASPAGATDGYAACSNLISNRFATATPPDGTAFAGFYAHLDPQPLLMCNTQQVGYGYGAFAFAAIQIDFADCPACQYGIVQIGRGACRVPWLGETCTGPAQRIFVGYGRDEEAAGCTGLHDIMPVPINRGPAPTDSGLHYYRVHTDGARWWFDHWPKGQALVPVFDIAASLICWTDRNGVTFNESLDRGDALGGGSSNHYNFLSMTRQQSIGGSWTVSPTTGCGLVYAAFGDMCLWNATQSWEAWNTR
jgi:hypothetical protein